MKVNSDTITVRVTDCETQRAIAKAGVADCGIVTAQTGSSVGNLRGLRHMYRCLSGGLSGHVGAAPEQRGGCLPVPEGCQNLHRLRFLQPGMPGGRPCDAETGENTIACYTYN